MLAFGNNDYGQLGVGTHLSCKDLQDVPLDGLPGGRITTVACNANATAVLLNNEYIYSSGITSCDFRRLERAPTASIVDLTLTATHAVAVTTAGKIHCIPLLQNMSAEAAVLDAPERLVELAAGSLFVVALGESGKCYAFGMNAFCALGCGVVDEAFASPKGLVMVQIPSEMKIRKIACGSGHTLAVSDDGSLFTWGRNNFGQLGVGSTTTQAVPVRVSGPLQQIVAAAAGDYHSLVITAAGDLFACGCNDQHQLGIGEKSVHKASFERVPVPGTVIYVAGGGGHNERMSVAVTDEGIFLWGTASPMMVKMQLPSLFADTKILVPTCGWRHGILWSREHCWDPSNVNPAHARIELTGSLTHLCADICMYIVAFLGAERDAGNAALTCRRWNEFVRFSPAYYTLLKTRFPVTFSTVIHQYPGIDPEDVDWRTHVATMRQRRFRCITNYSTPASIGDVEARSASFTGLMQTLSKVRSAISAKFSQEQNHRLIMLGLDAGGKTSILYMLKMGNPVQTIPTIGFNVEEIKHGGLQLSCWDVGGPDKIRSLWRHYYQGVTGIVFVIDCNDRERLPEARDELQRQLNEEELRSAALLIFANKQDLETAMDVEEVATALGIHSWKTNRRWCIQGSSVKLSMGIIEGIQWLASVIHS